MAQKTILACGYHNQQADRHWSLCRKLEEEGWSVVECHTTACGAVGKYWDLWRKAHRHLKETDAVLVTFPGQYLVPLFWLLTRMPRKRLVFDAFISLWDSIVDDRRKVPRWHPYAWWLFVVDWVSCHLADEVLIDTNAHRDFFVQTFGLKPDHVRTMYLDAPTDIFFLKETPKEQNRFNVLFYGTYIPLQGIEYILDAAALLMQREPRVRFTLIGSGQTVRAMQARTRDLHLTNVTFEKRVPYQELPERIRHADLCLGIFGRSPKAQRVIPHKVLQAVACGVPVLTADTQGIRERFSGHPLVTLCHAGDPVDIAKVILAITEKKFSS